MRKQPDQQHSIPMMFKGVGRVYVDRPTARLLWSAVVGQIAIGVPAGLFMAGLVEKDPFIGFIAGYGGFGIVGALVGMCFVAFTSQQYRDQAV